MAGQKFYFLKNEAVLLELALAQYAFQTLLKHGYTPIITPDVARVDVLEGIGFLPRGPETQIYSLENTDLCLIATAEITLGRHASRSDHGGAATCRSSTSACRTVSAPRPGLPAGTPAAFTACISSPRWRCSSSRTPDQSDAIHRNCSAIEESIFQGLGLPYQVIDTCTGDLGGPAYRKYDIEAWMPGRGDKGEYGEVTSTSNCTDYQSRRLNIRYKGPKHKGTKHVHTLNGTAVAVSRALVAVLENYQQADGTRWHSGGAAGVGGQG